MDWIYLDRAVQIALPQHYMLAWEYAKRVGNWIDREINCFLVTQKYISDDFPHNKFVEWKSLPLKVTTNPVLVSMKGMIPSLTKHVVKDSVHAYMYTRVLSAEPFHHRHQISGSDAVVPFLNVNLPPTLFCMRRQRSRNGIISEPLNLLTNIHCIHIRNQGYCSKWTGATYAALTEGMYLFRFLLQHLILSPIFQIY